MRRICGTTVEHYSRVHFALNLRLRAAACGFDYYEKAFKRMLLFSSIKNYACRMSTTNIMN